MKTVLKKGNIITITGYTLIESISSLSIIAVVFSIAVSFLLFYLNPQIEYNNLKQQINIHNDYSFSRKQFTNMNNVSHYPNYSSTQIKKIGTNLIAIEVRALNSNYKYYYRINEYQ
jgi:prepilin-type N-terminal cleavage/methylation domain-containing protein